MVMVGVFSFPKRHKEPAEVALVLAIYRSVRMQQQIAVSIPWIALFFCVRFLGMEQVVIWKAWIMGCFFMT